MSPKMKMSSFAAEFTSAFVEQATVRLATVAHCLNTSMPKSVHC